ncbi:MAG TPA: mevalonate kinase [Candidatus Thermoplasmatota archaeon]|nr:mevalonate kinase [Candidatus Thermoplasmatota archaeon]
MVTEAAARAPGKAILFGEHAVVFGEGAIAVALTLYFETRVRVSGGDETRVDGRPMDRKHHAYFQEAVRQAWGARGPLEITTSSSVPSSSGLGSSAALTVATVAALKAMRGRLSQEDVARTAFEVEFAVQGRASPTDTSTASHGRAVYIAREEHERHLWTVEKGGNRWCIHDLEFPPMDFVIGYTGKKGNTAELIERVRRACEADAGARARIARIGAIVEEGRGALARHDLVRLGQLMDENQGHLSALGVSSPELDALIAAARPHALGAKLTGAGGGGSMIALARDSKACSSAIERAGGKAFQAKIDREGVVVL